MHESHLVQRIVNEASEKARNISMQKIRRIRVIAGELLHFDEMSVKLHFESLSEGTPLEGAEVEVTIEKARLKCADCGKISEKPKGPPLCGICGSEKVSIESGKDFILESVEFQA